jgi:pyrroloquinoline quinone biosynthesis protein B
LLLTHAHIGHYLGLALFGFEAISSKEIPVWASPRMGNFLRSNGPWSQLVELENIELHDAKPGESISLSSDIRVLPILVPHRDEFSDTLGFHIIGPNRHALYIPDTSPWSAWDTPVTDELEGVDVALLDATFYSGDELPGRDLSEIGHPLVVDTMTLLQPLVDHGLEVQFIHLNHSNPAIEAESEERAEIERRGFHVATQALEIPL